MKGIQQPFDGYSIPILNAMAADASSPNSVVNAVGTVLGYIGAEAVTTATFTRLLWPQRASYNLRPCHLAPLAILLPSGGPLYKSTLQALDTASNNGLFRGKDQGHMLGTSFFPDSKCIYTHHAIGSPSHTEASRNNLWVKVMALLPFPRTVDKPDDAEKGSALTAAPVRARIAVRHLTLGVRQIRQRSELPSAYMAVDGECNAFSLRAFLGILATEISGIGIATIVASVWKSWFAVLWVCPLALKLLGAVAALEREPLDISTSDVFAKAQNFEVHLPPESGTFLVITGPPALVLQFFRHYGHPKRDRAREIAHLAIIIAFGSLFPLGLLCSVAWMPLPIQYIWLSYQMYVVSTMYISRYLNVETWASTEEGIAALLAEKEGKGPVHLWADEARNTVVEAKLETRFFARYGEGAAHVQTLIGCS